MTKFPRFLFLEITKECNLKCQFCGLWKTQDLPEKISLGDKITFLKNVIKWLGVHKEVLSVCLMGGEPFLYPNQVFEITKACMDIIPMVYLSTNGTLLKANIDKILKSGLTALNISIDSHIPEIHDNLRGRQGLFDYLIPVIKELISKRNEYKYPIKIWISSILGNWNINSLPEHIKFFKKLGVDGIRFLPIQYTTGFSSPKNWHKNFNGFPQSNEVQNGIDYLLALKSNMDFYQNSKEEIILWQSYFKNPEYFPKSISPCRAYEQNLWVDIYGNIQFCDTKIIEPKDMIGNIMTTPIEDIWNGERALQIKQEMKNCNRGCGMKSCNMNINLFKRSIY